MSRFVFSAFYILLFFIPSQTIFAGEAASRPTDLVTENNDLKREVASLRRQVAELQKQVEILTGGKFRQASGDVIEVSSGQLNTLGEKYLGKKVGISNAKFKRADNTWVELLPDDKDKSAFIGFFAYDSKGTIFQRFLVPKDKLGDFVANLSPGDSISIIGTVIATNHDGWYAVMCDRISSGN